MYEPINGWTRQEIIQKIDQYVPKDGCFDGRDCVYQLQQPHEGLPEARCAVGACLPDGEWLKELASADELVDQYPELAGQIPLEVEGLLHMQKVHDEAVGLDDVKSKLIEWVETHVNL